MKDVEVIEAKKEAIGNRVKARSQVKGLKVNQIRVAAYCRVSTDGDEQLGSFQSQKLYYEQKISANKEWINAGIFADEAITGTMTTKRDGFQEMITKCQNGEIDLILTKSISRFARNTVDTLQYVRMLRDKNIGIIFEKENINTLDMQGELLLTIMSSLAQQEVESLSQNVKMGLKMKMKRGELIGFNGCLGYDYHPEDKSITINEEEAETIRFIYDMYLQGYGTTTIAKRLTEMGKKNKKGKVYWRTDGVMGIIKNEKYKGDILLGKTFTIDPISKRRLHNMGEEEQYYIRNHHEPIVSREIWDKADEIRKKRARNICTETTGNRERYTRQYALSSMCECAFCGSKLTRRTRAGGTIYKKHVWQCMKAVQKGIKYCPNCKSIDERIIQGAFVEAFKLLAGNFDDVLEEVLQSVEEVQNNEEDLHRMQQLKKDISTLESKKSKMTDLLIDGIITKEVYDEKILDYDRKINVFNERRKLLGKSVKNKSEIKAQMEKIRKTLENNEILDQFDRQVFDIIIKKVYVGGYDEEGNVDPYKLTFVLKGDSSHEVPNARDKYKKQYRKERKSKI